MVPVVLACVRALSPDVILLGYKMTRPVSRKALTWYKTPPVLICFRNGFPGAVEERRSDIRHVWTRPWGHLPDSCTRRHTSLRRPELAIDNWGWQSGAVKEQKREKSSGVELILKSSDVLFFSSSWNVLSLFELDMTQKQRLLEIPFWKVSKKKKKTHTQKKKT